jgi:hypothetical protein
MTRFPPRLWLPYGSQLILGDEGFITEDPHPWSPAYPSELRPLHDLVGIPGLILIGEPGLGKSTEMRSEFERLEKQTAGGPDLVQWVSLGTTRESAVLSESIFKAESFRRWLEGDGRLFLFLDALDEARMRVPRIADLLLDGLAKVPYGRLSLRISCRSANRHTGLERGLRERFAEGELHAFELCPLARRDVLALASGRGLDAEVIVRTTIERDLQPLAMVPESLNFLLDVAEKTGDLPSGRVDAYERGLGLLVREPDEDRREERRDALDPGERLALASRVAAALVLSGRTSVGLDQVGDDPDQAGLQELAGGLERDRSKAVDSDVEASVANLKEVLETALFTTDGRGGRAFGQANYGEFLCARWLAGGGLDPDQLDQLLFMDGADGRRVVPQMNEVAAWLADQDEAFFARLLAADSSVLLRADPRSLDETGRHRLVAALLAGVASDDVDRWDRRMRDKYPALRHREIAEQLGAVIGDRGAPSRARQVAIDIAGACGLGSLEVSLIDLSLAADEDREVRVAALHALSEIEASSECRRLRPLALGTLDDDPDDELKGGALQVLWPDWLDAPELFAALHTPKRTNLLGQYKSFLFSGVLSGLASEDLPVALNWASGLPVVHYPTDALSRLREQLLVESWPLLTGEGRLLDSFVEVVLRLLAAHAELLSAEGFKERPDTFVGREGRRRLVEAMAPRLPGARIDPGVPVISTPPLLKVDDTDWLARKLLESEMEGSEASESLAHLLEALVSLGGEDGPVLEARESSALLRRLTRERYEPMRIDSDSARKARERYEFWQHRRRRDTEEPADLDIAGNVRAELDRFESGERDGFWLATQWLEIDAVARRREFLVSDLTRLPGWPLLEETDRSRLRLAARRYLTGPPPDPRGWFNRGQVNWPAWAGYRAIRLIRDEDEDEAREIDPTVWAAWVPVVVNWPRNDGAEGGEGEFNDWAIAQALVKAPEETIGWFSRALDHDLRGEGHPFALHRFRTVWDPRLEAAILHRARRSRLDADQRAELLEVLLQNGSADGLAHARRLVTKGALAAGGRRREVAIKVAGLLTVDGGPEEWTRIWPLVLADEDFGRRLIESLASGDRHHAGDLSARQAGELFSWILSRYPYGEDPLLEEAQFLTPRDHVGQYRDRVLRLLGEGRSRQSVAELGRLIGEHPELEFLPSLRRRAERQLQRSEWLPPAPQDVIRLSEDAARRHVRSASDLRQIAIASLRRAQVKLTGLRPAIADLWDLGTVRPKRERPVAAWIERHLRDDLAGRGIIVGREVEIRAHPNGQMGEAVDLLLTAVAAAEVDGAGEVAVSIELKCCWHRDLDTAMRDQLLERYLDEDDNQGIYLVAYFDSPDWEDGDRDNRRACRRRDLPETRSFFAAQAEALSAVEVADIDAFVLDCRLETKQ